VRGGGLGGAGPQLAGPRSTRATSRPYTASANGLGGQAQTRNNGIGAGDERVGERGAIAIAKQSPEST